MSETPKPSIRQLDRAFVGGLAWTAGGKWSTQLITWASVIALARILSPAELGLAGMAGIFNVLTTLLAEFGLGSAVVQMRDLKDEAIAQLHAASVGITAVFFAMAVLASPWIAVFFDAPEVRWLVVVNSIAIILTGFLSVPMALLRRALNYRRLAYAEAFQVTVRATVSVAAAVMGASYWSTVIGGLAAKLAVTILVLVWAPFRFSLPRWQVVREPLIFGCRVSVTGFMNTLATQVDPLIVAKRLGERALGAYQFAIDMANAPAEKINLLLMRVSGPLLASVQGDMTLVRRYFLRIAEPLSMSVFPAVAGFALVAPNAVFLLVGEKWESAIAPVQVLTLCAGMRALNALTGQVLVALHDVRFRMRISIAKLCILPVIFYFVSPYGLVMVALVWLVVTPIELVIFSTRMIRLTSLPLRDYGRALAPAMVGSAAMTGALLAATSAGWFAVEMRVVALALQVLVGITSYLAVLVLLFRGRLQSYIKFVGELRR